MKSKSHPPTNEGWYSIVVLLLKVTGCLRKQE